MRLGIYRPSATDDGGAIVCDWDEDSTTLAAHAARLVLDSSTPVSSITIISRTPSYLLDDAQVVLTRALRLGEEIPVRQILGGAGAVLTTVAAAAPSDLVIAVESTGAVGAAAVIGIPAGLVRITGQRRHSLPARVQPARTPDAAEYDDARLLRERGWRPAFQQLRGEGTALLTGVPRSAATRLGSTYPSSFDLPTEGSWSALAALGILSADGGGRIVAVEGASATAADVTSVPTTCVRLTRQPHPRTDMVPGNGIPLSLAAYERAFDAKVGLRASRCSCGVTTFPPRRHCGSCGRADTAQFVELRHGGTVYSVITVRTPVTSMPREYSLAIVDIDDTDVRALVHVTGSSPGSVAIGDHGDLVLRRVAQREGVPDYGFAFMKKETSA